MNPWIGILGYPLTKSLSPAYHQEKLKNAGLKVDFRVLEIVPEKDPDCLGFSVTMPYKERILFFCDAVDDFAAKVRAVNCVVCKEGRWRGMNTDALAFWEVLQTWSPVPSKNVKVVFLGCGATTRSLSMMLAQKGYRSFVFKNRSLDKAQLWAEQLKDVFCDVSICVEPLEQKFSGEKVFVLNTTPLGAYEDAPNWEKILDLKPPAWIFDVNYQEPCHPREGGDLIKQCRTRCFYTMGGLPMFMRQADLAFQNWFS